MSFTVKQMFEVASFMSQGDAREDMHSYYIDETTSCVAFFVKENPLRWCGEFGMLMARLLGKVKFPFVREDINKRVLYFPQIPFSKEEEDEFFANDDEDEENAMIDKS